VVQDLAAEAALPDGADGSRNQRHPTPNKPAHPPFNRERKRKETAPSDSGRFIGGRGRRLSRAAEAWQPPGRAADLSPSKNRESFEHTANVAAMTQPPPPKSPHGTMEHVDFSNLEESSYGSRGSRNICQTAVSVRETSIPRIRRTAVGQAVRSTGIFTFQNQSEKP